MKPLIVLLTDFGTLDPFVGIMRGIIATIAPEASTIDLSHEIPPGDIPRAAITLWQATRYFPKGSIFLVVVDPGVGTHRKAIILEVDGRTYVGPDNGVFSFLLEDDFQVWELVNPSLALPDPGKTFHGRDIFAPAAAYTALGVPGTEFGPPIRNLIRLHAPLLNSPSSGLLEGEVLFADHFGNLLTSLGSFRPFTETRYQLKPWIGTLPEIVVNSQDAYMKLADGRQLPWVNTFAEISPEGCAIQVGSSGLLEIVANRQSAANILDMQGGEIVTLRFTYPTS
jgi:S-adenosylmethionine hydrolase